ncbi:MAG: DAK2 domain-containing protein [Candidatus Enteromonas sp.]|nr:DAK2 domain-containing protein [Candidatus Enteromonas sp.]
MKTLTGAMFATMVENGYRDIKLHYEKINELNVFPVPDGDTGTNITATLTGGLKAMEKADTSSLSSVASALARGMLLGARGNSGVIVSQFFSGLSDGLSGLTEANITQFASSLRSGTAKAYKAVVKPVEGTILTVAREGSTYILDHLDQIGTFQTLFAKLLERMNEALENTPNLLPVLKEAGVIDSGGAGLVTIIEGMYKYIIGEEIEDHDFRGPSNAVAESGTIPFNEDSVLDYGYCTEFILQILNSKGGKENFHLNELISFLETLGDSIVALQDESIVKVHVHTKTPGLVLTYAQQFGEFVTFKMENMSIQHNEVLLKEIQPQKKEKSKVAVVAVAPSEEFSKILKSIGVHVTILGGQTMNPSAESFLHAFEEANAENIIVFPNNSNIILTAQQAKELYDKGNVFVIPTKSAIESYSIVQMFDFEGQSIEDNVNSALEQQKSIVTAVVSKAVRDSVNNGLEIHENDFIGISRGSVQSSKVDLFDCIESLLDSVEEMDMKSCITVSYGDVFHEEEKQRFRELIAKKYDLMDLVEIHGNQKVYSIILAIE